MPAPGPARRAPLSRDAVLRGAIAFADEHGLGALSMRKLGQSLGVEAMSLYNHVASKEDLVSAMLDVVVLEVALPAPGGDWKQAIRETALSVHRMLRQHRWACPLWTGATPGPARLQYMEALLACLSASGLGPEVTYHGYHVVDLYAVGFTAQQLSYQLGSAQIARVAADFLALQPATYPNLDEHVRQHLSPGPRSDDFAFGLELILDGLERMRAG